MQMHTQTQTQAQKRKPWLKNQFTHAQKPNTFIRRTIFIVDACHTVDSSIRCIFDKTSNFV